MTVSVQRYLANCVLSSTVSQSAMLLLGGRCLSCCCSKTSFRRLAVIILLLLMLLLYLLQTTEVVWMRRWADHDILRSHWQRSVLADRGGTASLVSGGASDQLVDDVISYDVISTHHVIFNTSAADVMVHVHIQKTGGTEFGKQLVRHLRVTPPCTCHNGTRHLHCVCARAERSGGGRDEDMWLFSRFSQDWPCGVHPTFDRLTACVPSVLKHSIDGTSVGHNFRYFYVSMLREPIQRYLSEWMHVRRGARWPKSTAPCGKAGGASAARCFGKRGMTRNLTLCDFTSCHTNPAHNRQSWMLASSAAAAKISQCRRGSATTITMAHERVLASARQNLRRLAYFGLLERPEDSQRLFEHTFGVRFDSSFRERSTNSSLKAASLMATLSPASLNMLRRRNSIDLRLYRYAVDLFNERVGRLP